MSEADALPISSSFASSAGLSAPARWRGSDRREDQLRVTQRFGGRQQHEASRRLGQLADAAHVVVLDVRRELVDVGKLESAGQLGGRHTTR
jgi:hypothetical protein